MKTVRQLVDFIFHSSQEQDADLGESERTFLGELNQIEPAKVIDKQPLVAALKKAGIEGLSGKLVSDASGIHAEFDNSKDYAALVSQLLDAGKLYDLAAHGWVATFSDDTASLGDAPNFRVNFLDIGEVEPGETKGHKAEDEDILAMDREAVAAYKEVNDLKGRKDSLKPKDDEKVSESMALLDSLENAADVVAKLLSRRTIHEAEDFPAEAGPSDVVATVTHDMYGTSTITVGERNQEVDTGNESEDVSALWSRLAEVASQMGATHFYDPESEPSYWPISQTMDMFQ